MKPVIVITRPLKAAQIADLQAIAPDYQFFTQWANPLPDDRLADVEIVLGGDGDLVKRILALPNNRLGYVQAHTAGVDYLDLPQLAAAGVVVANTSGIHAEPIAEYVLGAILQHTRGLIESATNQRASRWHHDVVYSGVAGKRLVVVGAGKVGTQVAKLTSALGMTVVGISRSGRKLPYFTTNVSLAAADETLAAADVVVDLLPLTGESHHFFDAERLARLKPGVMFINVGRGGTVDTAALIAAITSGQIGHAVLDVFETEPLSATSPLWQLPNTVITAHIAGLVPHFTSVVTAIYAENLRSFLHDGTLASHQIRLK